MRKFKQFISVVCIAFSFLFSGWFSAAAASPKIVTLKAKTERHVRQQPASVETPNFMRTDSLVFYEPASAYPRSSVLVARERTSVKFTGDSKYIYRRSERQRYLSFIYV